MPDIMQIHTTGYRGPLTEWLFVPPGVYRVGAETAIADGVLAAPLAGHMLSIGLAQPWGVLAADDPDEAQQIADEAVPDGYEAMSVEALRKHAADNDINLHSARTKTDIIVEIEKHDAALRAALDDAADADEQPEDADTDAGDTDA